jgi:glucose-1-phosphate cytidylyltransferase
VTSQRPSIQDLPVVILCGGQGTRLREETEYRPKPMVEIGDQPILWHIMKIYSRFGIRRFILCLGYKGWEIKQYFLRYNEMHRDFSLVMDGHAGPEFLTPPVDEAWQVTCAETGADSGTGGRLAKVARYIDTPTFFFTYGDAVGAVDVQALLDLHLSEGRTATVTGVHPTSRYGEMHVRGAQVVEFNEKPTLAEGLVSGGFFVFQREIFDVLLDDPRHMLELEPLQRLAREDQLSVYAHEEFWHPMDTYRDYLQLNELWKREAPWKSW